MGTERSPRRSRRPRVHGLVPTDDRVFPRMRVMKILVWSDNRTLSDLVTRNLTRRGFEVDEHPLPGAGVPPSSDHSVPDLAIVDISCPEPEMWHRASEIRVMLPGIPMVVLGHAWPTSARLGPLQPCAYVRKPFAIDELLAAVHDALPFASSRH